MTLGNFLSVLSQLELDYFCNAYRIGEELKLLKREVLLDQGIHCTNFYEMIKRYPKEFLYLVGLSRLWYTPCARPAFYDDSDKGSGNGWMRYEDGGESMENMVESGGGDGGLKGCLDPNLKEAKRDIDEDTAITKAGTKLLLHRAYFSCSWDTLEISTLKASAADT
ncbi:hypothetical protein Tco_0715541 [Tanacetum coccineum]